MKHSQSLRAQGSDQERDHWATAVGKLAGGSSVCVCVCWGGGGGGGAQDVPESPAPTSLLAAPDGTQLLLPGAAGVFLELWEGLIDCTNVKG